MPRASVYVFATLISGVSAALILASGTSYSEPRFPQGTASAHDVKGRRWTYNGCGTSPCQIASLNSVEDFCLWAPSQPALSATSNTEHTLVAWCLKSAHGTHLIPDGTISGARLVITPEYVQITGIGNLTSINVPPDGVASASGEGDRVHGLVFTSAYGQLERIYDWTSFVSQERFCFRACKPSATASTTCPPVHDVFGCSEDVPGSYDTGVFEDCIGDVTEVSSTLFQEVLAAPSHDTARSPSSCTIRSSIGNARVTRARRAITSTSGSTSSTLATLSSQWHSRSHRHSTPLTSSTAPTTTDTATTITFPSLPTSTLTATAVTNSSTPISSAPPTSTPHSFNHTHTLSHSHPYQHSHRHTSAISASFSSSSLSSHFSLSHSPSSSSTASSLSDPPPTSSASSPTSTPSFTLTLSTYSSSDPFSSGTSTSSVTSDPPSTPASTFTSMSSSSSSPSLYGTSSSLPEISSLPSSSYHIASPTSSPASSSTPSSTASSTASPTSAPTSPSMLSSTSSQNSYVLTFTTPYSPSSVPTSSSTPVSSTLPNSQTQLGSQCPPLSQVAVNAGSNVPPAPLFPLMLAISMIALSSSVGVLVF